MGSGHTPTVGFAVFDADRPAGSVGDTPGSVSAGDWQYASVQYTDLTGYTVNTAAYGAGAWQVTATDYDDHDNVVRSIDASDFAAWRAANAAVPGAVGVDRFATITAYNPDIVTTAAVTASNPDGSTRTVPTGTVVVPAGTRATDEW